MAGNRGNSDHGKAVRDPFIFRYDNPSAFVCVVFINIIITAGRLTDNVKNIK